MTLLEEIRDAFDNGDFVQKNKALRRAHDEIERLNALFTEPDMIAQGTVDPNNGERLYAFMESLRSETLEKNIEFSVVSRLPDKPEVVLFEGWKRRPLNCGEPRFQLVPATEDAALAI